VFIVVAVLVICMPWKPQAEAQPASLQSITLPETVDAGTIVSVDVVSATSTGVAHLVVQNAYGRLSFELDVLAGTGRLVLPAAVTQQAGVVTVSSGEIVETMTVSPVEVAELVAPLVGPRTIVADAQDTTLAVLFPVDRYGNQVADGTDVSVLWQQPSATTNESGSQLDTETVDGMAYTLIPSGQVAGATMIRATASTDGGEEIHAAAVRIDEVPGVVSDIEFASDRLDGRADGRSLIELESGELVDRFNNLLADGTVGHFVFEGPAGQGVVAGTVQNGVVRIELVSPSIPGTITGHLEIHGRTSNDVAIEFYPAIASFDVSLDLIGAETILRISTAVDADGAFVADGTEVRWGDYRTQIRRGDAEIRIPAGLAPTGDTPVLILGMEKKLTGVKP